MSHTSYMDLYLKKGEQTKGQWYKHRATSEKVVNSRHSTFQRDNYGGYVISGGIVEGTRGGGRVTHRGYGLIPVI